MPRYRLEAERTAFLARAFPDLTGAAKVKNEKEIVARLFAVYPDMAFWKVFKLPFEMESLSYFLGVRGKEYLRCAYLNFHFEFKPRPASPVLDDHKHGKDRVFNFKPRTLREFLNE